MVEQCNRDGGSVEQRWWNSGISDGGTVEHVTVEKWNRDGGTVEHLMGVIMYQKKCKHFYSCSSLNNKFFSPISSI